MTTKATWVRGAAAAVGTLSIAGAFVLAFSPVGANAAPSSAAFVAAAPVASVSKAPSTIGLPAAKLAVDTRIRLRLATLSALKIAVNGATDLTGGDKTTLATLIGSDTTGLTTLKTKVDAETTVAAVKADGRTMVVGYRVYMLVVPKVRFNIAADKETTNIARLKTAHDQLAALATGLAAKGKDTAAAQAKIDDMASKLAAATAALGNQAQTLLGVAPSPDPAAMKAAVAPVRAAVKGARGDIKDALADAKAARDALKTLS